MALKMAYFGVFSPHCSDQYRINGFHQAGVETYKVDFRKVFKRAGDDGLVDAAIHTVLDFQPDFVLVNKGEVINSVVLSEWREIFDCPILLFYGDKRNKWDDYLHNVLSYYDAFLINSDDANERKVLSNMGVKKLVYHHSATDLDVFRKYKGITQPYHAGFFGGNYRNTFPMSSIRQAYIVQLIGNKKFNVKIHGAGWGAYGRKALYGDNFSRQTSMCKILLGF
jgi:hypothetical protein